MNRYQNNKNSMKYDNDYIDEFNMHSEPHVKKEKKSSNFNNNKKDVGFLNVNDPNLKNEIIKISKCPDDATNFIFWYNKTDPEIWGLTIKSIIKKKNENENNKNFFFGSQHTWKITWYNDNKCLRVAQNSKSLADDIDKDYDKIADIFMLYKNK